MQPPGRVDRTPRSGSTRGTEEHDSAAPAWATLRSYENPDRYLRIIASGTSGPRGRGHRMAHPLLRPPASLADQSTDAELIRSYLAHSCDLTLRGGVAAAVTYPLAVCALAEHYVVRRIGGASPAAVTAAAVAAAELGRTTATSEGVREPVRGGSATAGPSPARPGAPTAGRGRVSGPTPASAPAPGPGPGSPPQRRNGAAPAPGSAPQPRIGRAPASAPQPPTDRAPASAPQPPTDPAPSRRTGTTASPATTTTSPLRTTARLTTTGSPVRTEGSATKTPAAAGSRNRTARKPSGTTPAAVATTRPDAPAEPPTLAPGYAGLAQLVGWLAGDRDRDSDSAPGAGGRTPRVERRDRHRLARLLQPSPRMRAPYRLLVAATRPDLRRPGWSARRMLAVAAAAAAVPGRGGRVVAALVGAGLLLTWAGLTVALLRSPSVQPWVVAVISPALLVTVLLAGVAATVLASVVGTRRLLAEQAPAEQYGLVPGVQLGGGGVRGGALSSWLDRVAGVPDPAGLPPLCTWLATALDDLAGIGRPRRRDGPALTFGDLWLGRQVERRDRRRGRPSQELDHLRRAAADPEHRMVDLRLVTTDLTRGRPVQLPFGSTDQRPSEPVAKRWLFCPTCLAGGLPPRVVDQMVVASPRAPDGAGDLRCPTDDGPLLALPEPWDVPVVVAVRMAAAAPGLLRAVPLYTTVKRDLPDVRDRYGGWTGRVPDTGPDVAVITHWFCGGGPADAPVSMFDSVLPRWPTFGLAVTAGFDQPDDADGHWVEVPETSADPGPRPAASVTGLQGFVDDVRSSGSGWRDRAELEAAGTRGRVAIVRRGAGATDGPFLAEQEILRLALRGHHAGRELRARFVGRDGEVAGQTGTDRHRWVRLRSALRDHRRDSLTVAARFPVYADLAAAYRVPAALSGWFRPPLPPGRVDPAWADATAALTHLTSLTAGGVLDWDTDFGAPPPDSESPPA